MIINARILVVDDSEEILLVTRGALSQVTDQPVQGEKRSAVAADRIRSGGFDLLVTDLRMPAPDGLDLLRIAQSVDPDLPVIILTGYPSLETAVAALKVGASDYLTKPVNLDELVLSAERLLNQRRLQGEHRLLQRQVERPYTRTEIVGETGALRQARESISKLASFGLDLLIVGETGTGKELMARTYHEEAQGESGPFVPVDCGAIPETLMESEFFGHERGAFSGADKRSVGLLEFAHGGTLFLDELGSLPVHLQAKLLRALQERSFRRLGSNHEIRVSVRVAAAVNRSPEELIREGLLREDLFHRLNVGRVDLVPLRFRRGDIPLLAEHFNVRLSADLGVSPLRISPETMEVLMAYPWPGNVRELQNLIKRSLALVEDGILSPECLPERLVLDANRSEGTGQGTDEGFFAHRQAWIDDFERRYIRDLLVAHQGDVSASAQNANIPRGTLYRLMKKHHFVAADFRE